MVVPHRVGIWSFIINWAWLKPSFNRGLITLLVGIATFFKMPPSPTQTKSWFRPKGWFTDKEETIAVSRILRDDPTKVCFELWLSPTLFLIFHARATCITEKDLLSNAFGLQFATTICGHFILREFPSPLTWFSPALPRQTAAWCLVFLLLPPKLILHFPFVTLGELHSPTRSQTLTFSKVQHFWN